MAGKIYRGFNKFLDFVDDIFYKILPPPERPTGEMLLHVSDETNEANKRALELARKDRPLPYCSVWPEGEMLLHVSDETNEANKRALELARKDRHKI